MSASGTSASVIPSVIKHIKEIFPQHSDSLIASILQECNNDVNACMTRLLSISENNDEDAEIDRTSTTSSVPDDFLSSPQFHLVTEETQKYSIGYEYSIIFNRTEEQGLDINVKAIGQRILVNEVYTNKVTGLPGLCAQAGVIPGDIFVGIDHEYFNVGCALPDITRITRAAGRVITLQFFRYYDNSWLIDILALERQGEKFTDVNSEEELRRMYEKSASESANSEMLYHKYNCNMNDYRDLYTFQQQLMSEYGMRSRSQKIHHCAFLLSEQELLKVADIDLFTETIGRLLSRCLSWDSGSICERNRICDILLAMLSSGMLTSQATIQHSDGNHHGYTLNSLRFLSPVPDVAYLKFQLPIQFNVSSTVSLSTRARSVQVDSRRSSTGNISANSAARRSSTGMAPRLSHRSLSQQTLDAAALRGSTQLDHPNNASIRLLWRKSISLNTFNLRPALGIRITNINVVENSHVEYKIWVNDVDTGLEWYVYRRFSEIHNFRETIVAIWPLFGRINFPPRRLSLTSSVKVATERLPVLEQFLRTVYSIVSVQPLTHVSTRAIYSALQDILDVTFRNEGIRATMEHNRELFLNSKKVTETEEAEEEESVASSRAMSSESGQGGRKMDSLPLPICRRTSSATASTPVKEDANSDNGFAEEEESLASNSRDNLVKYGMLMEAVATSSNKPRRHSLFGDDSEDIKERLSSVSQATDPMPPPLPPSRKDTINSADVAIEKEHDFVALRSPSGLSPSAGGRKRISSLSRTHLPKFDKLPSFDIFEQPTEKEDEDNIMECDSDDSRTRSVTNTSSLSLGDRPPPASLCNNSSQDNTSHPPAYSRVLSKRLEVFVHWVLQIPTFRHIIDPFVKKFRNKILEWELDRTFILNEELVYDRLKFIAEFIDNLQEVLLEGLSADMDSISTYIVSKQCDSTNSNTSSVPAHNVYYIRKSDDHAIDRSTNRGRSYSVNDGRMSNVVVVGIDLELMYRKVIRRQVEYEIYFPSRDAIDTMMSHQFASIDNALERKCNILKHKPQSFFGISVEHMSPSSWETVITAFGRISAVYTLPVDKLDALVVAAKMIPDLFEKEHCLVENPSPSRNDVEQNVQSSLSADDMLPIFIYCLVMSNTPFTKMQSLVHELDFICDTQSRYSEVGYFVTTFQASIQHILHMDEEHGETLECE